ncbi:hypothetical protein V7056_19730 [Bacillus sp. JJ664]
MEIGDKQREIQSKYRKTMNKKKEEPDKNGVFFIIVLMLFFVFNLLFKSF